MRAVIALGVGLVWAAAAQVEKPAEPPTQKPPLHNTGKPMVVDYRCSEEDIPLAGLSCTLEDPCPVYLELDSLEAVGNRIFLAGNIHTATTTLYSILLASGDAGKTWREPYERLRASGLDSIQFLDFENGWISGELQHPLPRDPFLLVTSDGGETWRAQPVFAEPQFGSILQFFFSSRTSGALVIDRGRAAESGRYELYETPNAGETWRLRQSNERPIKMKRAGDTANADWRLRADAATKAYCVERHVGDRWHGIASFSVSIGTCKPPEMPVVSPDESAPGATNLQRSSPPGR